MKSIAILSFYSGHHTRGVERWARDVASQLSNEYKITIIQNGPVNENALTRPYSTVSVGLPFSHVRVNWLSQLFFLDYYSRVIWRFSFHVLNFLIRNPHDIIIPTDGGWEPAVIRIFSWITGKKMVIVGHSGIGRDDANNIWAFPDTFVALSSTAKAWAKRINPFVKTIYIPDGVDMTIFSPANTKKHKKAKTIVAVGALTPTKRIDCIIKAVSLVPDCQLMIVGEGEQKKYLQTLAEKLLPRRYQFVHAQFSDMPGIYSLADLLVSASEPYYSFEMVLIEAMASGVGIVANDDPIRREIVNNAGMFVDPTDTDVFAKTIQSALLINWKEKARLQAQKFSWETVSKQYKKLFDTISA